MLISPEVMHTLLYTFLIAMALIAGLYLRRRSLPLTGYLFYAALIVFVPLLGPFLTIAIRPGTPRLPVTTARQRRAQREHHFLRDRLSWFGKKRFPG